VKEISVAMVIPSQWIAIAISVGILLAVIIVGLIFLVQGRALIHESEKENLIGCAGVVLLPLDGQTLGKVRVTTPRHQVERPAKTSEAQTLEIGQVVYVIDQDEHYLWVIAEQSLKF
jgi:hypothetical protein